VGRKVRRIDITTRDDPGPPRRTRSHQRCSKWLGGQESSQGQASPDGAFITF
jgi:hypothetical protein